MTAILQHRPVVHRGSAGAPVIVAVGPMLHPVLHAIGGLDPAGLRRSLTGFLDPAR